MAHANPYIETSTGNRRMLGSVVLFADVLGIKKKLELAHKERKEEVLLGQFLEVVDATYAYLRDGLPREREYRWWGFKSFSDNIAIAYPIEGNNSLSRFYETEIDDVIYKVSILQIEMITRGFFIRGGLSMGRIYMDDDLVFGYSLVRAVGLENTRAFNPRVILDSERRTAPIGAYSQREPGEGHGTTEELPETH